jgi:hypothetical protein
LENFNAIAALQEAAWRLSMLRIILVPSGNPVVPPSRCSGMV